MTRKLVALCGAVLALLLVSGAWVTADAHRGGGGGGGGRGYGGSAHHMGSGGYRFYSGNNFRSGHVHRFHHNRTVFLVGAPYVYGYYDYADGCYWMRQRALYTGSRYWWSRYHACLYGDY